MTGKWVKVTTDFVEKDATIPYLSIELEGTIISNFSISGHNGGGNVKPLEFLSLNFTKVKFTSKPTAPAKRNEGVSKKTTWNTLVD